MNSAFTRLSTPAASSVKLESSAAGDEVATKHRLSASSAHEHETPDDDSRPYYGKCQYKTGKCFNERTLKRNGEVHSLCEEHRVKQNLIQRRSDRKYQTVHAIRRRERSQRRAVLKKQVSMAVAQQLFYEHQQQKTLGVHLVTSAVSASGSGAAPLPPSHQLHRINHNHHAMGSLANAHPAPASVASLVPSIAIPTHHSPFLATSAEGLASPMLSFTTPSAFGSLPSLSHAKGDYKDDRETNDNDDDEEGDGNEDMDQSDRDDGKDANCEASGPSDAKPQDGTPTGIDDFTPDAFLNLCCSGGDHDAFETFAPILSARAERELWTEADIDFLQTLLLA